MKMINNYTNKLINDDCFNVMPNIPDKSIDCIISDMPYNITACKFDKEIIDLDKLWIEYKRIIKPNGAICLFGSQPFTSKLVMSNPKWFKYEWIWQKAVGSNFAVLKYQPMKEHENILVFSNGKHNYYPIKEERKGSGLNRLKNGYKSNGTKTEITGMDKNRKGKIYNNLRNPSSIQYFNNRDKDYGLHPTLKCVALYEYLIKTYTKEKEIVLDSFAGVATNAIACINTNRQYICIEKDKQYYEKGIERIKLIKETNNEILA